MILVEAQKSVDVGAVVGLLQPYLPLLGPEAGLGVVEALQKVFPYKLGPGQHHQKGRRREEQQQEE